LHRLLQGRPSRKRDGLAGGSFFRRVRCRRRCSSARTVSWLSKGGLQPLTAFHSGSSVDLAISSLHLNGLSYFPTQGGECLGGLSVKPGTLVQQLLASAGPIVACRRKVAHPVGATSASHAAGVLQLSAVSKDCIFVLQDLGRFRGTLSITYTSPFRVGINQSAVQVVETYSWLAGFLFCSFV
jgi:hypothetical protein